jgi:hypothetical protein
MESLEYLREKKALLMTAVCGGFLASAFIYMMSTRTLWDLWNYCKPVAIVLTPLLALMVLGVLLYERTTRHLYELLGASILVPLLACLLAVTFFAVEMSLRDFFLWSQNPKPTSWLGVASSLAILMLGAVLFYFRLHWRSCYGVAEASAGVVLALQKVFSFQDLNASTDLGFLAWLVTASIFLVVRGFVNVHEGLGPPAKDKVAAAVIAWIRAPKQSEAAPISTP